MCSSNEVSALLIEELQYTLGEGPCVDAYQQDRPVLEPDLAAPAVPRWVAFAAPPSPPGRGRCSGSPRQVGAVRLGALNFYRDQPGPLSADQHADALVTWPASRTAVLGHASRRSPGALAAELEAGFRTSISSCTRPRAWSPHSSTSPSTEALIRLRSRLRQ